MGFVDHIRGGYGAIGCSKHLRLHNVNVSDLRAFRIADNTFC